MSKPYEVPLDPELASEILNIPIPEEPQDPPTTMGERVARAIQAVEAANEYLATSQMARIIADTLMRKLKKRGTPKIQVRMDGTVVLIVSYEGDPHPKPQAGVRTRPRQSNLPTMDELREQARTLRVDISHMGRRRRAIFELLQEAESRTPRRMVDEITESDAPGEDTPRPPRMT